MKQEIIKADGIPEKEFEALMHDVLTTLDIFKKKTEEWAAVLARMSRVQIKRFKQGVKGRLTCNQIEMLIEIGRGNLAPFWAERQVPPRIFRDLPAAAKKTINNPNAHVEVLTPRGVVMKTVKKLNPVEVKQILGGSRGILNAHAQQKALLGPAPKQAKVDRSVEKAFAFDGMNRSTDGSVLIYGRHKEDPAGSRSIAIRMMPKDLKLLK